jgi:circadian clock protein KaiB
VSERRSPPTKRKAAAARARRHATSVVAEDLGQLRRRAARAGKSQQYVLRLYVTGTTAGSVRAIEGVRALCEEHLRGRYQLEVIDIYQMPTLARDHQIVATPTLIKVLPSPLRRYIGDLSKIERVLFGLDLREKT